MKKILITGFEAFDNDATNPSGDWINWMGKKEAPADREIKGLILPVTFNTAFDVFKRVFDDFGPEVVILTGLAKNRQQLTVERIGINWVDARIPDNEGVVLRAQKIHHAGPDGLFTTIDIEKIIALSEKSGSAMKLSTSAGEYVCNDLLYKVLCYTKDKNSAATFIHLPGKVDYQEIYHALESVVNGL